MSRIKSGMRKKGGTSPCRTTDEATGKSLETLVQDYIQNYRSNSELEYFEKNPSFSEALEKASMAINDKGKRFDHQRRLPSESLKESKESLFKIMTRLNASKDFAELHDLIKKTLDEVCGVGELFYYDTALRLGAFLKLFPECVYLHRGTRDGAKALGLDWRSKTLDLKIFPQPIQELKPHEIEDFLCIYKKHLLSIHKVKTTGFSRSALATILCCKKEVQHGVPVWESHDIPDRVSLRMGDEVSV